MISTSTIREPITLAVVTSDSVEMGRFLRREQGIGAQIVVQQRSDGHIQIRAFHNRIDLSCAIAMLRMMEQVKSDSFQPTTYENLIREGTVPGAESWYYQPRMILNGSRTNQNAPVTKLTRHEVVKCIRTAIAEESEGERQKFRSRLLGLR